MDMENSSSSLGFTPIYKISGKCQGVGLGQKLAGNEAGKVSATNKRL